MRVRRENLWWQEEGEGLLIGADKGFLADLGDVVQVVLPAEGARLQEGSPLAEVEVETAGGAYLWMPAAPFSGRVVRVNKALQVRPELLQEDPEGEGWILALKPEP